MKIKKIINKEKNVLIGFILVAVFVGALFGKKHGYLIGTMYCAHLVVMSVYYFRKFKNNNYKIRS